MKTIGERAKARLLKSVVMVGMMGSGKTAIGRSLAAHLGVPFVDSDAEIEEAAQATIAEIFERDGEAFFRDRETEVLGRLLSGTPSIISTGGGAYLSERNRQAIHDAGIAVRLDADVDLLWDRVKHKDTRPLLRTKNPRATLNQIFAERAPIYAQAELSVRAERSLTIEMMTARVMETLATRPDILELTDE